MDKNPSIPKFSKVRERIALFLLFVAISFFGGCASRTTADSIPENQLSIKSNNENQSPRNTKSLARDFSNKPVNLNNPKEKKKFDKQIEALNYNRNLWRAKNITNYDFVCEAFAGGMTVYLPALINVRENKTVSIEEIKKYPHYYNYNYEKLTSFEMIFDFLQEELESGSYVQIKYHKEYGYPQRFSVQYGGPFIHDYNVFEISKFEAIK